MSDLISETIKFAKGLDPVADAFSGTKYSDSINLGKYQKAAFIVQKGAGDTGTSTFTVECSSDASRTGAEAIPFSYRRVAVGDTAGDITHAAASGFTSVAGGSEMYIVEVDSSQAPEGKPWFHLKAVEVVDAPVAGAILVLGAAPKYAGDNLPSMI